MTNYNNIEMCRVCLNEINFLINIFKPDSENILKRLREFVEVKVNLISFVFDFV